MKTAGHYTGLDVRMVPTGEVREVGTRLSRRADGTIEAEPIYEDVMVPGEPTAVCIPASLVSTEDDGTVTVDVRDPSWPGGPQRRSGIVVGPAPIGGHATFHLVEDHPA